MPALSRVALRAAGLPDTHSQTRYSAWAIKVGDQLALVDSGTGGHPVYGQGNGQLRQSMAGAGLDPKSVKTILMTHLHGDHIYGLMNLETNAQNFPDAEIVVPAAGIEILDASLAQSCPVVGPKRTLHRRGDGVRF
jgi:glyoxylase-like metal-dependent hydrolase (beta-lactamase superfamily II)